MEKNEQQTTSDKTLDELIETIKIYPKNFDLIKVTGTITGELYSEIKRVMELCISVETQGWIDIQSELPNDGRDILLGDIESGIVATGFMSFQAEGFIPDRVMTVTHWKELPEGPTTNK